MFRSFVPRFGIFQVSVTPHHPTPLPRVFFDLSANNTPVGRVVFQLFRNVAPKTTENFLRLAVGFKHPDGKTYSYANSDFFSILPMRGIWGGDLAGGKSVSIYGTRFVDETYAISHNREGLLTTANFNGPNANDSRFIITMGPAQWLDRRSVAFGEVIHGLEILRQIELYGNAQGTPQQKVTITQSGQVSAQDYDKYTPHEKFDVWAVRAHH